MKIRYFSYYMMDQDFNYYHFDLQAFFDRFCNCLIPQFKKSFQHIDETMYLFSKGDGGYVLIKTKSDDIIKKIDTNSLSFDDIKKMLAKDDKLGYAAYLYVQKEYFALGSSLFSPKIRELQKFVSLILQSLGVSNNFFMVDVLTSSHDKTDIIKEKFIGASTISIGRDGGVFEDFKNILLGRGLDQTDIGSFEVTIKPRRGRSIKKEVVMIADNLKSEDYDKFVVRAKDEKTNVLTDIYLDGSSAITDVILERDEIKILGGIKELAARNFSMKTKASAAYRSDEIEESIYNPHHDSIFNQPWDNRINLYLNDLR